MAIYIIYGKKVHAEPEGRRRSFCGACLETTEHWELRLLQRSHVYFISYGQGKDVGRMLKCDACDTTIPLSDHGGLSTKEIMVDTFLDAHVLPLEHADKSLWVGAAGFALACLAALAYAIFYQIAGSLSLSGSAHLIAASVLLAMVAGGYFYIKPVVGNWLFDRMVRERLTKIEELSCWPLSDIARRSWELGYPRLAQFLGSRGGRSRMPDEELD